MAKLVDAWDLKSPARKGVPVRFRLRAPSKIKGLRAKADANPCLFPGPDNRVLQSDGTLLPIRFGFVRISFGTQILHLNPDFETADASMIRSVNTGFCLLRRCIKLLPMFAVQTVTVVFFAVTMMAQHPPAEEHRLGRCSPNIAMAALPRALRMVRVGKTHASAMEASPAAERPLRERLTPIIAMAARPPASQTVRVGKTQNSAMAASPAAERPLQAQWIRLTRATSRCD